MQEQEGFIDGADEQQGQNQPSIGNVQRTQYEGPDSADDDTQVDDLVTDTDGQP